jgi:CRISPR-associated protein Cas1
MRLRNFFAISQFDKYTYFNPIKIFFLGPMIKRTLYFGNPVYLHLRLDQLVIEFPNDMGLANKSGQNTIPIEDIGVVVLDHKQITCSHSLINALLANNAAIITCDDKHHPVGLMLPLDGHTVQTERFKAQIDSSLPLKKQLWAQTVQAKIENQAAALAQWGKDATPLHYWAKQVRSGDPDNYEARAAAYYWSCFLPDNYNFYRKRDGIYPNSLLNYGYSIVRALVARALVGSGLLPTLGIFHRNKYNAYCLADDMMEPFRPVVDLLVRKLVLTQFPTETELALPLKKEFLGIPAMDVDVNGEKSPLMVAATRMSASLARCFMGEEKRLALPSLILKNH